MQLLTQLHNSGNAAFISPACRNRGSCAPKPDQLGIGEINEYALRSFYDFNFVKQLAVWLISFERTKSRSCTPIAFTRTSSA